MAKGSNLVIRDPVRGPPKVNFGKFTFDVNWDVPEEVCLPDPDHYRIPAQGDLGYAVQNALRYLYFRRSTYIWGPPGVGKDALVHMLCARTRQPSLIFEISPDHDIMSWFYDKSFNSEGIQWVEGELLKALRDGYTSPVTGRQVPYTILFSDFDRASKNQAEAIRLVCDSIQGRIKGPNGQTYKVLPGTCIVLTANTMGSGDETGRCISSQPIDASILSRIERKVRFPMMSDQEIIEISKDKFPRLTAKVASRKLDAVFWNTVQKVCSVLFGMVRDGKIFAEFSLRDVFGWLSDAEDCLAFMDPWETRDIQMWLGRSFHSYLDSLGDEESRTAVMRAVTTFVSL